VTGAARSAAAGPHPDPLLQAGERTWRAALAARLLDLLLVLPALAMVLALFVYPLGHSLVSAFTAKDGTPTLTNFSRITELYAADVLFTLVIVAVSAVLTGVAAVAIGGYLVLGENPAAVAALRWLYRWPLFIPFIVAAQCMRTFLAKNGMMNNALDALGLIDIENATGLLDWRGIVVTFVWKQTPFVALIVAGAMAALDRGLFEAARNLGASRLRILLEIIVPQVRPALTVGLILSFVTMLSVLSVPIMISGGSPTMLTVDMAFRITAYSDYGVANALGFISYAMTGAAAWVYLRRGVREGAPAR
jgi:ABC-type sugar transport system permease subunit